MLVLMIRRLFAFVIVAMRWVGMARAARVLVKHALREAVLRGGRFGHEGELWRQLDDVFESDALRWMQMCRGVLTVESLLRRLSQRGLSACMTGLGDGAAPLPWLCDARIACAGLPAGEIRARDMAARWCMLDEMDVASWSPHAAYG